MDTDIQHTPEPGPPKKGFWGFVASLFPKQPKPHDHVEPSSQSSNPAEHASDEQTPPSTSSEQAPPQPQADTAAPQADAQPVAQPAPEAPAPTGEQFTAPTTQQPAQQSPEAPTAAAAPQQEAPADPLAIPVPTIQPDHDPQPLAVPDSLQAEPIEADGTKVSPTLQTQEPGAGESPSETPEQEQEPATPQSGTNPTPPTQQS